MRKRILVLLAILLSFSFIMGENLKEIISKDDNYLYQNFPTINKKYLNQGYHPELIQLNNKIIKIARVKGDSLNTGRALYNLGTQYKEKKDFDKAIYYYLEAIRLFDPLDFHINLLITYNSLFQVYDSLNDRDSAKEIILKAEKLLTKVSEKLERIRTYDNLSNHYKDVRDYDKAVKYQMKALEIARKHDLITDIAASYLSLGSIYLDKEDYALSWQNYKQALDYIPQIKDRMFIAYLYNNISALFNKQKKYNLAYEYAIKSIEIKEELGQEASLAKSYLNLGAIYFFAEKYELAIESFKKGIQLASNNSDIHTLVSSYLNLAVTYNKIDLYDSAITTYDTLLALCEEHNFEDTKFSALGNLAIVYQNTGDFQKSIEHSKRSLQYPNRSPRYIARNYINISTSYTNLEEWQKAIEYASEANRLSYQIDDKRYVLKTNKSLAVSYAKLKQYKQAYDSLAVYAQLLDEISEEDKKNSIEELRIRYESEKKDNLINDLELESELNKLKVKQLNYQRLLALIALIIIIFISLQRFFNQRKIIKIKEQLNKELEIRVKEETNKRMEHQRAIVEQSRLVSLGELAAGIAHELNQPLQCISFALENMKLSFEKRGYDQDYFIERMKLILHDISRMSSVVDHIRIFSRKQTQNEFSQFNLNETIKNALKLISEQYSNHNIEIQVNLQAQNCWVYGNTYQIEQVILNLLTNAKDALETNSGEKYIKINLTEMQEDYVLIVENNGQVIPEDIKEKLFLPFFTTKPAGKGTGLGLSIVYGIISEHNGTIALQESQYTSFKITLPKIIEDANE